MTKSEQIISTSKDTISSIELKNKNILEEIESLKRRQYNIIESSYSSYNILDESIKWYQCDILKNKIDDIQNTLDKFTKWTNNLNLLLGSQMTSYNKASWLWPKNNSKIFSNICNAQPTSTCKTIKRNYCNKDNHIVMFSFIKNSHESKEEHPHSYFYKEHCERKNRNILSHNIYSTNTKWPKKIWVPKE